MRSPSRWTRPSAVGAGGLLALVLLLGGCGSDEQSGGTAKTGNAANCTPKVELPTAKKGELSVVGAEYPPLFTFHDRKLGGVDGEVLEEFAKLACVKLNVQLRPAAGVIETVQSRRADLAAGGWYITPDREKLVNQSDPIYSDPPVIVSKDGASDLNQLKGKTIGTTQGYLWVDDLKKFAGDKAKLYQSPDAVFAEVGNGRIDAALMAVGEASHRLKQNPGSGLQSKLLKPNPALDASERPAVTNFPHTKGNTAMNEAINKLIREVRDSGKLAEILKKYGIDEKAANPPAPE